MERKLIEVAWEVTDACNFNCIHCYNPRKRTELGFKTVVKSLDELKEMGVKQIKYGGGEPLLRKDFLIILKETISRGFETSFSTNGFIVNQKLIAHLKSTGLSKVQVSLDGCKNVHNQIRQNPQAYNRAVNAIKLFVSAGFKVSVATTLIKPNLNCLEHLFNLCLNLKVNRWRVMKYIPFSRIDLMPSVKEYFQAQLKLKEFKRNSFFDVFIAREFDEVCEQKDNHDFQCFGGRTVMSIKANGDISPCSYFPYLVVGNLKNKSIKGLWNSSKMIKFANEHPDGTSCSHFRLCQGGCKAASFYALGKIKCDPYCWINSQI